VKIKELRERKKAQGFLAMNGFSRTTRGVSKRHG